MKSPAKHKWWAEGSMAKLRSSLWNSFPELTGNSPWPPATENYLQKQYVKISNWSQIHLKDKAYQRDGKLNRPQPQSKQAQGTKKVAVISLELGDQLLLNSEGPSGLGFFPQIRAIIRTSLASPASPSEQNPWAEFKNIFILFKTW